MTCNTCGSSISDTSNFCNNCGAANSSSAASNQTASSNDASYSNEFFNQGTISRVEALFTDPVAPTPPSNHASIVCSVHASAPAGAACVGCGSFFCRNCLIVSGGRNFCHLCCAAQTRAAQQQEQRQQQRRAPPLYAPHYPPVAPPPPHLYAPPPAQQGYQHPQVLPPPFPYTPAYPFARPPMLPVKRKEPAVALLLSFFMPGLGQIYNGDVGKGILFLIGFWVLVWIFIGWIFWLWAMIDAHQSATDINFGRRA